MKKDNQMPYEKQLQAPFHAEDIKWRVQQAGLSASGSPYVMVIPYVSNRAIQKRLDEVFGVFGWENSYKPTPDGKGYICGITIHMEGKSVTKWDGAEYTKIEPLKGALSDSMKRSAVHLGIGRYLYQLDATFARCVIVKNRKEAENLHTHYPNKNNKSEKVLLSWSDPNLPAWALPVSDYSVFIEAIKNAKDMDELKTSYKEAYRAAEAGQDDKFMDAVIEAKDSKKIEIENNQEQINQSKYNDLDAQLEKELSMFEQLPSESTVTNYKNVMAENITSRTLHVDFDCSGLFQKLELAYTNRINQLKKGN